MTQRHCSQGHWTTRPLDNDEIEWQGGRVNLHLGARQDDSPCTNLPGQYS